MTRTFRARYDGKVFIPEEPVDVPRDQVVDMQIAPVVPPQESAPAADLPPPPKSLAEFADWIASLPPLPDSPGDASIQHDHYLYGTPKRSDP